MMQASSVGKRLVRDIPGLRVILALIAGLATCSALLIIAQAFTLMTLINGLFLDHQGWFQLSLPFFLLLMIVIGRAVITWSNEGSASWAAGKAKRFLRARLAKKIHELGPAFTQTERSGALTTTLVEGTDALDAYFGQFVPQALATAIIPVLILIVVFTIDTLSGVTLLVTAPLLPVILALIGKRANVLTKRQWDEMQLLGAHFLDVLQGFTTLKLFGRTSKQRQTIKQLSERFRILTMGVLRIAFLSAFVMEMGATISMALIAVEIGLRLLYGQVDFSHAFLVLLLAPEFYLPLRLLGTRFHASMAGSAAAEQLFQLLDRPIPVSPLHNKPELQQALEIQDLTYSYSQADEKKRAALQGVSLTIKRGEKIAIVGASGAGKSTLVQLLLRFFEPDSGKILADDQPASQFTPQAWRELIAWVPQRPYLFHASIAENIRLGKPDATDEEVQQAARAAFLDTFILTLPQGYETIIGERGAGLSGGQIQRISLARAFLKNAPLLLLDEATANLDSENESEILAAIQLLMQERMVLIIAHRLHTVRNADRILLFQEGKIAASGSHTELLESSPLYHQLNAAYQEEVYS